VTLVQDFQRYMAKLFYYSRYPGGATSLALTWPAVGNWNVWRGQNLNSVYSFEYIDPTKKPLGG
jgi:hypothetical protein